MIRFQKGFNDCVVPFSCIQFCTPLSLYFLVNESGPAVISSSLFFFKNIFLLTHLQTQTLYDCAVQNEASGDWKQVAEKWKACVNETLRQTEECRVQCEVASQRLPEDRGVESVDGAFEKAAGKKESKH